MNLFDEFELINEAICPDYLAKDLDPEQLTAVNAPICNVCVNSVAGSGKTRVLTYRVANLIYNGVEESNIMLLTFTNKAADEMTSRVKKLLDKKRINILSGTFHSVAAKFLRLYPERLNFEKNFTIIDGDDQKKLIDKCRKNFIENLKIDSDEDEDILANYKNFPSKQVLSAIYSGSINHNIDYYDYINNNFNEELLSYCDDINFILNDYVKEKYNSNLMDFDDLLYYFMKLLEFDDIKEKISSNYPYILVDEYQDVNWMQYQILESLNSYNCLFVIGDDNQCIYQFRGSNDGYIRDFESNHINVCSYKLTYNYRSSPEILSLAQDSINYNDNKDFVVLNAMNKSNNDLPKIHKCANQFEEAEYVVNIIQNHYYNQYENIALLFRNNTNMRVFENELVKNAIPYKIVGGNSLFETEHGKDLLSILQFIDNYKNEIAFQRFTKTLNGIGTVSSNKIYTHLKNNSFDIESLKTAKGSAKVKESIKIIYDILSYDYKDDLSDLIDYILKIYLEEYINNKFDNSKDRLGDIEYIKNLAESEKNLSKLLEKIILTENSKKQNNVDSTNAVTLITMHKSKGLEFPIVFMCSVCASIFPRITDTEVIAKNVEEIQNERKLFYVAVTRAKKELYLSFYKMNMIQMKPCGASSLLKELNKKYYEVI